MEHQFNLTANWNGGLQGEGKIAVGNLESVVSIPQSMKGPGHGTNPEEMLLGAAATCFLITLAAILERRQSPLMKLELSSEASVTSDGALRFTKIVHRPRVSLAANATDEQLQTARDACQRAEKACMISNAIRGNVEVRVEGEVLLAAG